MQAPVRGGREKGARVRVLMCACACVGWWWGGGGQLVGLRHAYRGSCLGVNGEGVAPSVHQLQLVVVALALQVRPDLTTANAIQRKKPHGGKKTQQLAPTKKMIINTTLSRDAK